MVADLTAGTLKKTVTDTLDKISTYCGVDIFLLGPKLTPIVDGLNGDNELRRDQRWRVAIYGDILSSEHAKTRVLIHIDQMVRNSNSQFSNSSLPGQKTLHTRGDDTRRRRRP